MTIGFQDNVFFEDLASVLRSSSLSEIEQQCQFEDQQMDTKMWRPLRKLYRQHLFNSLLPLEIRNTVKLNSISVLNISTSFFCRKSNDQALIEVESGRFGRPCPECIGEPFEVGTTLNIEKLKVLIKVMKDKLGLQVVTFVGQGEPLEKEGHRKTVFTLMEYVHNCGLIPQLYTGGHSLDEEALCFLKRNQVCVLLSTYGLPFLRPDIFDTTASLDHYSDKTSTPDGRVLMFSQRHCAENVKALFSQRVSDSWQTNIAISAVVTPGHVQNLKKMRQLKNFTLMAKSNNIAVFAWEEYRKGMPNQERRSLERTARLFSSWAELGSLYVWNRCLFGTGGSITILGNGQVTHCPHTTTTVGFGIDDLVNESGSPTPEGVEKLKKQAHKFDQMSCILRGTKVGEREPAVVFPGKILGEDDIHGFLSNGLEEFPYIKNIWTQSKHINETTMRRLIAKQLKEDLAIDHSWFTLLKLKGTKCLSPSQRYICDELSEQFVWQKVASGETGHFFHNSETELIDTINISSKIIGDSVLFLGLGEKEDRIIRRLSPQGKTIYLVDIRESVALEKAQYYRKHGFEVHIICSLFEDIGNNDIVQRIVTNGNITIIVLGCTVGNFPQKPFWENLLQFSSKSKTLQIIVSIQVTSSIDKEQHIQAIKAMYDEEGFRSFAFKPFDDQLNKSRFYVNENGQRRIPRFSSKEMTFDTKIENGLGGIVGRIQFLEKCNWEHPLFNNISIQQGEEIQIYTSLKPDLHNYIMYLKTIYGINTGVSILGVHDDIALLEIQVSSCEHDKEKGGERL